MGIKKLIKEYLGEKSYRSLVRLVRDYFYGWHSRYYSEYGEDSIVNCLIHYKKEGFYVDIGAFHPKRLSSTYYFYKRQKWDGLVIEPNPENIKLFEKVRPRDKSLNFGIGTNTQKLTYYMFDDASQNTFSEEFKQDRINESMQVIGKKEIDVFPLAQVLAENMNSNQKIDYMNVDVEGLDLEVLKSNDWDKYRPSIITIEEIHFDLENPTASDIYLFMKEKKYSLKSVCFITLIFVADEFE